jgi:isoleucyl-tRNA synthetase
VLRPGYEVLDRMKGSDLAGIHYEPLYTFYPVEQDYAYVVTGDFVSTEDGSGIVHIAPAFGADDMEVGKKHGLPVLMTVGLDGAFKPEVTPWAGVFVKTADPAIQAELASRGLLYKAGAMSTPIPSAGAAIRRCSTWPRRPGTSAPANIATAWCGQPDRSTGTRSTSRRALWQLAGEQRRLGAGPRPLLGHAAAHLAERRARQQLRRVHRQRGRTGGKGRAQAGRTSDLHRPYVDESDLARARRRDDAPRQRSGDAWFDSGSMPVAQWHYPFANQEVWERQKQADYICEAIDQTRGWFYTLHAVSTLLFDRPAYKNVICLGHILAEDGSKMSKSKGNVVNPWEVFNTHGADATRWYMYTASPPGNSRRFSLNLVGETVRRFLNTLWNTYSFFVTYANLERLEIGDWRLEIANAQSPISNLQSPISSTAGCSPNSTASCAT